MPTIDAEIEELILRAAEDKPSVGRLVNEVTRTLLTRYPEMDVDGATFPVRDKLWDLQVADRVLVTSDRHIVLPGTTP